MLARGSSFAFVLSLLVAPAFSLGLRGYASVPEHLPQGLSVRFGPSYLTGRQSGSSNECRLSANSYVWQSCDVFAEHYNLTIPQFVRINPTVLKDCTAFVPGKTYCIVALTTKPVSLDGTCARGGSTSCIGSRFGDCCGKNGKCGGSTSEYCSIGNCQDGDCPGLGYSNDGLCGPDHGDLICGGQYGNCCSNKGVCGSTSAECGIGNCLYGDCDGTVFSSTASSSVSQRPVPTPGTPSPNGTCGKLAGYSCVGTQWNWGNCCGEAGQSEYGLCDAVVTTTVTVTAGQGVTSSTTTSTTSTVPTATQTTSRITTSSSSAAITTSTAVTTSAVVTTTRTTSAAVTTTTTSSAPVATWIPQGCYKDLAPDTVRPLPDRLINGGSTLTIQSCQAACLSGGYIMAGVENGNQCFCGHDIQEPSKNIPVLESDCSKPCVGNSAQTCGNAARVFLYRYAVAQQVVWQPLGCHKDLAPTTPRPRPNRLLQSDSSVTIDGCQTLCRGSNYALAGLENGNQCFCGNEIQNQDVNVWVSPAECNKACTGNRSQTCGAAARMYIYQHAVPERKVWKSLGCHKDLYPNAARLLDTLLKSGAGITIDGCHALCQASAYRYSGLENGSQCWCGNALRDPAVNIPSVQTECRTACTGNAEQICGSGAHMHVYEYVNA